MFGNCGARGDKDNFTQGQIEPSHLGEILSLVDILNNSFQEILTFFSYIKVSSLNANAIYVPTFSCADWLVISCTLARLCCISGTDHCSRLDTLIYIIASSTELLPL